MMEKEKKRMEKKTTRRPYCKPQLEQVRLVAEEAVLTGCKSAAVNGPTVTAVDVCTITACEVPGS